MAGFDARGLKVSACRSPRALITLNALPRPRSEGRSEPHVLDMTLVTAAYPSLRRAIQDDQPLLRTIDHLEQVGRAAASAFGVLDLEEAAVGGEEEEVGARGLALDEPARGALMMRDRGGGVKCPANRRESHAGHAEASRGRREERNKTRRPARETRETRE